MKIKHLFFSLLSFIVLTFPIDAISQLVEVQKITEAFVDSMDGFGNAVALSGNYMIVSSSGDSDNGPQSGSAYIYKRQGPLPGSWTMLKKLSDPMNQLYGQFGWTADISGDHAIVSTPFSSPTQQMEGGAWIFGKNKGGPDNWGLVKTLKAADGAPQDWFGVHVAIHGNYVVVGACNDDDLGSDTGSAYLYQKDEGGTDNWGFVKKFLASDAVVDDRYGVRVDVQDSTVAIGTRYKTVSGLSDVGQIYVYDKNWGGKNNWGEMAILNSPATLQKSGFGTSFSLSSNWLAVLSSEENGAATNSGAVHIFNYSLAGGGQWLHHQNLILTGHVQNAYLGTRIKTDGHTLLIGEANDMTNGVNSGTCYHAELDPTLNQWVEKTKLYGSAIGDNHWFGAAVAIDGKTAAIGAFFDNHAGMRSGSVYIFDNGTNVHVISPKRGDDFLVYPNPTAGTLTINLSDVSQVRLYNQQGQIIGEHHDQTIISTTLLNPGMYTLTYQYGKNQYSHKVIKQ